MTISSFSYSDDIKHKILLQADYPNAAQARSHLDHNMPSTAPTPPIADVATTVKDDGSQHPASVRDRASINYLGLQTPASKRDRASIQTRPLYE